jgi:hypothetical protein
MSQPDPTAESPMTAVSRSHATALWMARLASGLLPPSYTTAGDVTGIRNPALTGFHSARQFKFRGDLVNQGACRKEKPDNGLQPTIYGVRRQTS